MARSIDPTILTEIFEIGKSISAEDKYRNGTHHSNENLENILLRIHEIRNILLKDKFSHIHIRLSKRELQIIMHICEGKTTLEIANNLNLSKHTVESHRTNIFSKLDVRNSIELVALAFRVGLVNPNDSINTKI